MARRCRAGCECHGPAPVKAIFTRANDHGTFDSVGMANRMLRKVGPRWKTAARAFANGRAVRCELFYTDNVYRHADRVEILPAALRG